MPKVTLRFFCKYCNATIAIGFTEQEQEDFKKIADKWPYPLVYTHAGHWAIIYVDNNFAERGVIVSKVGLDQRVT